MFIHLKAYIPNCEKSDLYFMWYFPGYHPLHTSPCCMSRASWIVSFPDALGPQNTLLSSQKQLNETASQVYTQIYTEKYKIDLWLAFAAGQHPCLEKVGNLGTWFPRNLAIWRENFQFQIKYIRKSGKLWSCSREIMHFFQPWQHLSLQTNNSY